MSRRKPRGTNRLTAYRQKVMGLRNSHRKYPRTGQVHLEYALEWAEKNGRVLTTTELEQHLDSGKIAAWKAAKNAKVVVSRDYFLETGDGRKIRITKAQLKARPEKRYSSEYRETQERYRREAFDRKVKEKALCRLMLSGTPATVENLEREMAAVAISMNFSEGLKKLRRNRRGK